MKKLPLVLALLLVAMPAWAFTRTTIITDPFNTPSNWVGLEPGNMTFLVSGGVFTSQHDASDRGNPARWSGTDFDATPDQFAVSQIISITAAAGASPIQGVICRASGDLDAARDFYFYLVRESAGSTGSASRTTDIGSVKNGTVTVLATGSVTWAPNDTIEMECTGSSTTTITGFKNGVATGQSYSDSSSPLTTGRPGVLSNLNFTGDNFVGGSLTASAAAPVRHRVTNQ